MAARPVVPMLTQPDLVPVKPLPGEKKDMFIVRDGWTYYWEHDGKLRRLNIPDNFRTDGASVPRWLWSLSGIPPIGLHNAAAVAHDFLYHHGGMLPDGAYQIWNDETGVWEDVKEAVWTREEADRLFCRILRQAEVEPARRRKMYYSVRVVSWVFWHPPKKGKITTQ